MHKLLERQIKRFLDPTEALSVPVQRLLEAVSEAYHESDKDRLLLERSLELTSQELLDKNQSLQEELVQKRIAYVTLQHAQTEFSQLIEGSPFGVIVRRDDQWIFVNQAMAQFLGYEDPSALLGRRGRDFAIPEDAELHRQGRYPLGPNGIPEGEVRFRRRDGEIITLYYSPAQRIIFEGQPAILIFAQDYTEKKKLEAGLLLSDRLASLGSLAAGIAHEINNPLSYILLNSELALNQPNDPQELKSLLEEIQAGAEQVKQIVQDLKLFSRPDEETRDAIDPLTVLESACSIAYNEIRHKAGLIKEFNPVPPVWANSARLGQVFINLLVNAAQATPPGSRDQNRIYLRSYTSNKGEAVIEVQDTGSGIPEEIRFKLFTPFFTTKPIGVGNGLGLSICLSIVASLGGKIEAENAPECGALFRVTLPASPVIPKPSSRFASKSPALPKPARVLLIDDEVSIGVVLRRGLSHCQTSICFHAQDALQILRKDQAFDVILCDVMMPSMTGIEFYQILEREFPTLCSRVIFMTGGVFSSEAATFLRDVPNPCLEKPFTLSSLYGVLLQQKSPIVESLPA